MKRWREWTEEERLQSQARAAYLFLNIVPCSDCGLPWADGLVHRGCPGPAPEPLTEAPDFRFMGHTAEQLRRAIALADMHDPSWRIERG